VANSVSSLDEQAFDTCLKNIPETRTKSVSQGVVPQPVEMNFVMAFITCEVD
jgi:hypothetical protein